MYNRAQWNARQAAICLGNKDWSGAIMALTTLKRMLESEENWNIEATKYTLDNNGEPMPYTPRSA